MPNPTKQIKLQVSLSTEEEKGELFKIASHLGFPSVSAWLQHVARAGISMQGGIVGYTLIDQANPAYECPKCKKRIVDTPLYLPIRVDGTNSNPVCENCIPD